MSVEEMSNAPCRTLVMKLRPLKSVAFTISVYDLFSGDFMMRWLLLSLPFFALEVKELIVSETDQFIQLLVTQIL